MNSAEIRQKFLDFFESKGHTIVPSAPMVIKNDPTLMFTNAGMNQFKDIFLGNRPADFPRVANSQKCLRVSGKHNDLEEVGVDTYHHTMFEMLGNWSFSDYFKKEAIAWAWELLTEVYKLDKDRLYVSVFAGEEKEGLSADEESANIWKERIAPDRVLYFSKKDNFWEMGDTGPCGPCSEIHVDLRSEEERKHTNARDLVNNDHPQVIEIWNLVFIQYNRKADGSLESLPAAHVDTGMGFERLVRALQAKSSNYDSDVFMDTIQFLEKEFKMDYGYSLTERKDIAFRVIADHIRAISFAIADGQLPSNTGAGYVIRRILRRAIRYGYSYLNARDPFLHKLVNLLSVQFKSIFPELDSQKPFVSRVIFEEEKSFLKTLDRGIDLLNQALDKVTNNLLDGQTAFVLFDTFGFPIDLTRLISMERGIEVDMEAFKNELNIQKERSRSDAVKQSGDWFILSEEDSAGFKGYDQSQIICNILKYKEEKVKDKVQYQLVLNETPFYAESGGQVGDSGYLTGLEDGEKIEIIDTKKENELIIHYTTKLPQHPEQAFLAEIDIHQRTLTEANHSATHLLHAALRKVLGEHVAQKGSLVNADNLRFDFSHFAKMTDEEIKAVETLVNEKIKAQIELNELRDVPIAQAKNMGAMALFGEKYGDKVRVIQFDPAYSVELCGGTHVRNTAAIGTFKILTESSVAAGVRRIEAITSEKAMEWMSDRITSYESAAALLGNPKDLAKSITTLLEEKDALLKQIESFRKEKLQALRDQLQSKVRSKQAAQELFEVIHDADAALIKDLLFRLKQDFPDLLAVIASEQDGKPAISVMLGDTLVSDKGMNAAQMVKNLATHIQGGGGGQPFFATAGGKDVSGLEKAIESAKSQYAQP